MYFARRRKPLRRFRTLTQRPTRNGRRGLPAAVRGRREHVDRYSHEDGDALELLLLLLRTRHVDVEERRVRASRAHCAHTNAHVLHRCCVRTQLLLKAADCVAEADVYSQYVRARQAWGLLPHMAVANVRASLARVVINVPGTSFNFTNLDGGNYATGVNLGPIGFTNN